MEVDQSLLESLPQEQRQKLARRLRQEQIRRYHEREREQFAPPKLRNRGGTKRKTVAFKAKDRLRDATGRSDQAESKKGNLPAHKFLCSIVSCIHAQVLSLGFDSLWFDQRC